MRGTVRLQAGALFSDFDRCSADFWPQQPQTAAFFLLHHNHYVESTLLN